MHGCWSLAGNPGTRDWHGGESEPKSPGKTTINGQTTGWFLFPNLGPPHPLPSLKTGLLTGLAHLHCPSAHHSSQPTTMASMRALSKHQILSYQHFLIVPTYSHPLFAKWHNFLVNSRKVTCSNTIPTSPWSNSMILSSSDGPWGPLPPFCYNIWCTYNSTSISPEGRKVHAK